MSLLALVLAAAASTAQPQWKESSPAEARQKLREFAECAARRDPKVAHRFVMLNQGELLPPQLFRDLFSGRCLGRNGAQLRMRQWRSRAALAEALIRQRPEVFRPASYAAVPALNWAPVQASPRLASLPQAEAEQREAMSQAEVLMSQLGECVVRNDAPGVLSALQTDLDGAAEKARLQLLAPKIASCIRKGDTLSLNRTNLRSALALAYYRLGVAAQSSGAGK